MKTKTQTQILDQKIDSLKIGGSVLISEGNGIKVTAERSAGDGKKLRFVRTFTDGSFTVFRTTNFN